MDGVAGARTFAVAGRTYDDFMGRYSVPLSEPFADAAGVAAGATALDLGCGPGALTGVLLSRLGPDAVYACDPSPPFRDACAARHPGAVVELGRAEEIPFEDDSVDLVLAQLVLHFVSDPPRAAAEMTRVARPGGTVAACVWDAEQEMEMLRLFWDAAASIELATPAGARTLRFGRPGEIAELFAATGLEHVTESTIEVASTYGSFDELWSGFLAGIGPAGAYCASLGDADRDRLRAALLVRCGAPDGSFTLSAVARSAVARVPA